MKRFAIIGALILIVVLAVGSSAAGPDQTIAKLKQQNRQLRLDNADLQDEVDAQNAVIGDQTDTILRLRTRINNQPDPLDAITNRSPDGLWQAMRAIWLAFPTLDPGSICGYDKSVVPGVGDGLTLTTYSFSRWTGC